MQGVQISIHAPREGRDSIKVNAPAGDWISIHAPREGRDLLLRQADDITDISIHAPREGRDRRLLSQATHKKYFNPRAPRGARRQYHH